MLSSWDYDGSPPAEFDPNPTMWGLTSMDMYHEILKRLPVRSLCRFCCVCKTWRSHIKSPHFMAAHLATHSAAGDCRILWATTADYSCEPIIAIQDPSNLSGEDEGEGEGDYSRVEALALAAIVGEVKQKYFLLESGTYKSIMDFQFSFNFPTYLCKPVEILACVNGVLLLNAVSNYQGSMDHTILWNPMVCKWIFLPRPHIRPKGDSSGLESWGFGFDPSEGDFRVVRLLYIRPGPGSRRSGSIGADSWKDIDFCTYDGGDINSHDNSWNEQRMTPYREFGSEGWPESPGKAYRYPPEVEVCYVKERTWRKVNTYDADQVLSSFAGTVAQHQCYMNASVHWVARAYNSDNSYSTQLLVFNFETERFHSIKLPDQVSQSNPDQDQIVSVAVYKGLLSISDYTWSAHDYSPSPCCSLWLMSDYPDANSWAKLVSIPLSTIADWVLWLSSQGDDEVLVCDFYGRLTLYDPVSAVYRGDLGFKPAGCLGLFSCPYACAFKESLYLLDEDLP